ncbi:MAG: hypothetical protein DWI09_00260 [Planctomycetota bacterium]|nr:MAG: hypothetical protein DWI09_00260 [Planctomycetota bacterium]
MQRETNRFADEGNMSAFGPTPIPVTPSAVQASFIAQHATGARAREKSKPQEADAKRSTVRDEIRLSDPLEAQAVDSKPDAVEEWKHQRGGRQYHDPRLAAADPRRIDDDDQTEHKLDLKA